MSYHTFSRSIESEGVSPPERKILDLSPPRRSPGVDIPPPRKKMAESPPRMTKLPEIGPLPIKYPPPELITGRIPLGKNWSQKKKIFRAERGKFFFADSATAIYS